MSVFQGPCTGAMPLRWAKSEDNERLAGVMPQRWRRRANGPTGSPLTCAVASIRPERPRQRKFIAPMTYSADPVFMPVGVRQVPAGTQCTRSIASRQHPAPGLIGDDGPASAISLVKPAKTSTSVSARRGMMRASSSAITSPRNRHAPSLALRAKRERPGKRYLIRRPLLRGRYWPSSCRCDGAPACSIRATALSGQLHAR